MTVVVDFNLRSISSEDKLRAASCLVGEALKGGFRFNQRDSPQDIQMNQQPVNWWLVAACVVIVVLVYVGLHIIGFSVL
jgi:hypothetical protein